MAGEVGSVGAGWVGACSAGGPDLPLPLRPDVAAAVALSFFFFVSPEDPPRLGGGGGGGIIILQRASEEHDADAVVEEKAAGGVVAADAAGVSRLSSSEAEAVLAADSTPLSVSLSGLSGSLNGEEEDAVMVGQGTSSDGLSSPRFDDDGASAASFFL